MPTGNRRFSKAPAAKTRGVRKGQSSSCNPTHNRFRLEAKSLSFGGSNVSKGPGLTLQQLRQHDGATTALKDEETLSIGGHSCASTYDTIWSTCSNMSMKRFLTKWNPSSALHKEMLAVFGATTDVIRQNNGKETETEYLGVLMTTLEAADTDISRAAVASLLAMIVMRVPPAVLKKKFSSVSMVCINLLEAYMDSEQVAFLRGLISLLTATLKVQELAVWNESSTLQVFSALFPFVTHPKPKVRKFAQRGICKVLQGSSIMLQQKAPSVHPAAARLAQFCVRNLEGTSVTAVPTSTLHLLGVLRAVLPMFSQAHVKATCEAILHVMTAGHPMVVRCSIMAIHSLFLAKPAVSSLSPELNAQLLNALYDYQPSINDAKTILVWLQMMLEGLMNLHRISANLCLTNLPKFLGVSVNCWLTEKTELHVHISGVITTLLQSCVRPLVEALGAVKFDDSHSGVLPFHKMIGHLDRALQYQFHAAWAHTVHTWAVAFDVLGGKFPMQTKRSLQLLADLRDTNKFLSTYLLDKAIGSAVKAMGPRIVLEAVPLKITGHNDDPDFPRSWLLPLMRDSIRGTELAFFVDYFLPLANTLHHNVVEEKERNAPLSKTYQLLELQIWALLPGFCTAATDIVASFSKLAKTLGEALNNRPDLRLEVMSALRLLINTASNKEADLAEVGRFAKNFLPIFFNLYTQETNGSHEEGARLAVYDTIKVYIGTADRKLCSALFLKATEKLSAKASSRHAILDLARALLCKMDTGDIQALFDIAKANIQSDDRTLQKKSYRVLEEICHASADTGQTFLESHIPQLQNLLLDNLRLTSPSSRAPRLRCLCLLMASLNQSNKPFALAVLREAVLCVRVNSAKVRQAAYLVVLEVGRALSRWSTTPEAGIQELVEQLAAGFAGSAYAISCTVLALSAVLYEFKGQYAGDMLNHIVDAVGLLMASPSREVIQASLYFVRMLLVLLKEEELALHLEKLVTWLCNLTEDCRKHFRVKLRNVFTKLIRRFGYENIAGMVPESHRKQISNIRKIEARRKKLRQQDENEEEVWTREEEPIIAGPGAKGIDELLQESSDEELPEDDQVVKRKKGRRASKKVPSAWIEEQGDTEIVDFLDPSAGKKITYSTNPKEERKAEEEPAFKMSKDGKIIIGDPEETSFQHKQASVPEAAELLEVFSGYKAKGKRKRDEDQGENVPDSKAAENPPTKRPKTPKMAFGAEGYRAKKASGDIRKRGKLEPFAYVPLNRKALNKRTKGKPQTAFKNLIRAAQRGSRAGRKKNVKTKH
ncbi:RRP12-like protein [Ornithodoros turicata]|uniref:RRP12-like protein n=1 Tax=Ornithodoros turicata TaxID=34597 RepID=UPI0031390893